MTERTCSMCKIIKDSSMFHRSFYTKDGLYSRCRECRKITDKAYRNTHKAEASKRSREWKEKNIERHRENQSRWNKANKEKRNLSFKRCNLKREYGMSVEEFDSIHLRQGGLCKICKLPPSGIGSHGKLHVDHNHITGKVRGLLCGRCNTAIGMFNDDPLRLLSAVEYLSREEPK